MAKTKASKQAKALRKNPYFQRIAQDADLRQSLFEAYDSACDIYARLSDGKKPHKDRKLQKDIKRTARSIQSAGSAMQEGPKRRNPLGKLLVMTVVGAVVALVVSEDLRNKLLDMMFGAEESFEYTSATTDVNGSHATGTQTPSSSDA